MKLTSLKQTYSEMTKPYGADSDEYYPSLYLDEKQLEAMGIDAARVGTEMKMVATVRVSSASESKNGSRSMSLEIIEAGVGPKETDGDAANKAYVDAARAGLMSKDAVRVATTVPLTDRVIVAEAVPTPATVSAISCHTPRGRVPPAMLANCCQSMIRTSDPL